MSDDAPTFENEEDAIAAEPPASADDVVAIVKGYVTRLNDAADLFDHDNLAGIGLAISCTLALLARLRQAHDVEVIKKLQSPFIVLLDELVNLRHGRTSDLLKPGVYDPSASRTGSGELSVQLQVAATISILMDCCNLSQDEACAAVVKALNAKHYPFTHRDSNPKRTVKSWREKFNDPHSTAPSAHAYRMWYKKLSQAVDDFRSKERAQGLGEESIIERLRTWLLLEIEDNVTTYVVKSCTAPQL